MKTRLEGRFGTSFEMPLRQAQGLLGMSGSVCSHFPLYAFTRRIVIEWRKRAAGWVLIVIWPILPSVIL